VDVVVGNHILVDESISEWMKSELGVFLNREFLCPFTSFLKRNNKSPTISLVTNDNMSRCSQIGAVDDTLNVLHSQVISFILHVTRESQVLKGTIKEKHDLNGLVHQPPSAISPPVPNSILNFHSRRRVK